MYKFSRDLILIKIVVQVFFMWWVSSLYLLCFSVLIYQATTVITTNLS